MSEPRALFHFKGKGLIAFGLTVPMAIDLVHRAWVDNKQDAKNDLTIEFCEYVNAHYGPSILGEFFHWGNFNESGPIRVYPDRLLATP